MTSRESADGQLTREIRKILRAHPEYGHTRLARELAARGIEVKPFRLRQLLKEMRGAPRSRQHWGESPLAPSPGRDPPPRYIGWGRLALNPRARPAPRAGAAAQ